jgi:hypothetical protein
VYQERGKVAWVGGKKIKKEEISLISSSIPKSPDTVKSAGQVMYIKN